MQLFKQLLVFSFAGFVAFTHNQALAQLIEHPITKWGQLNTYYHSFFHDMDLDGDLDIVTGNDTIWWLENNGAGQFSAAHIIADIGYAATWMELADLDGDGDQDVMASIEFSTEGVWYENVDGLGSFGPAKNLNINLFRIDRLHSADLDGDGDLDVFAYDDFHRHITWNRNVSGSGDFEVALVLDTPFGDPENVQAFDVDNDGNKDLFVYFANHEYQYAWYENIDGTGAFGEMQLIFPEQNVAGRGWFEFVDIDNDGHKDILDTGGTELGWLKSNGDGTFNPRSTISTDLESARVMAAEDLDGDGDQDALSASFNDNKIAWYENTDGAGTFGPQQLLVEGFNNASFVDTGDVDGDGDQDVLGASGSTGLLLVENLSNGNFQKPTFIAPEMNLPQQVIAADLDNNGFDDVIFASSGDDKIGWYRNMDGSFGLQEIISLTEDDARSAFAADLDGDNDLDIVTASAGNNAVSWYNNLDGEGTFGQGNFIGSAGEANSVYAADLDNDGDHDVMVASVSDHKATWFRNDGAGNFGEPMVISAGETIGALDIIAADFDNDDDLDIAVSGKAGESIVWFENTDGAGSFSKAQLLMEDKAVDNIFASDIDGDNDMDLLASIKGDHSIIWFENTDESGQFSAPIEITDDARLATSVYAADIDGDGDIDVISTGVIDDQVAWYENTDGAGTFGPLQSLSTTFDDAQSVVAANIDGQKGIDFVVAAGESNKISWFENPFEAPLPVALTAFNAITSDNTVHLTWETASETNNAGFDVEIQQGATWETLAFVGGKGTTVEPSVYQFTSPILPPGQHRFRLKQIDFDGTFAYSPIAIANIGMQTAYHLSSPHPNPFNPQTQTTLTVAQSQHVVIEMFDLQGRVVNRYFEGRLEAATPFEITFNASTLSTGVYLIRIQGEFFLENQQVVLLK